MFKKHFLDARETCNIQQPHKELRDSSPCKIQESIEEKKQYKWKDTFISNTKGQHSYQHCHRFISLSTSISSMRRLYNQVKTRQAGHWHAIFAWNCILYQHAPSHACHTNALRANKGFRVSSSPWSQLFLYFPPCPEESVEGWLWRSTVNMRTAGLCLACRVHGRSWDGCRTLWARALLSALSILIYYMFYWTSSFSINVLQTPVVTWKTPFQKPKGFKGDFFFQTPAGSIDLMKRNSCWPCQFQNWTGELRNELRRRKVYCWGRDWGLPPYSALQPASCFRRAW